MEQDSAVKSICCGNELPGVSRWDDESNDSVYERCGVGTHTNGVNCGVTE